ncbi:hypothetical protein NP493_92g04000 [Ridgeia piscesae]|uniref:Protein LTV1 homolog n=1 Tax=Ridgeia piscesae TaxID=27915 RepID=A0AAD9UHW9_RIDPI|nr:hypothetical protein NP493_92g04000 [Ridgeia piscesae]
MPGRKKKFIDKKGSVTFHLVHRSQRDPLQADDEAPQHVLMPLQTANENVTAETRLEELKKYGVFYDDDYDYMQHLRDVDELYAVDTFAQRAPSEVQKVQEPALLLPSTVFATKEETDIGLLNKAVAVKGPQPDWDPDIVAALDDDFDFNNPANQLDDDFIAAANASGDEGDNKDGEKADFEDIPSDEAEGSYDDDVASDIGSLGEMSFTEEETKSRFTSYSMSSSVVTRNAGLTLLDDRFEKLYEQYDDEEIGALDQDEIAGYVPPESEVLQQALQEFEGLQNASKLKDVIQKAENMEVGSGSSESDDELEDITVEKQRPEWDCESILSTYSNLYNHPKTIEEPRKVKPIRLSKGRPVLVDEQTERQINRENKADVACTYRPRDEMPDEKKARKKAVKEERRVRRVEKKATRTAFKEEKIRLSKEQANLQKNQSIKII